MKFSIIIPVYNLEKYIARCLDSVFEQDILESEYEVICVDDCSSDSSVEIVERYKKSHSNIKLVNLLENRGSGYARSVALSHARGEYIWFVDGDDTVFVNSFNHLFEYSKLNNLDILFFNFQVINESTGECRYVDEYKNSGIMSGIDFVNKEFGGSLTQLSIVWKSIYSRKFIVEHRIVFPDMRISEDSIFAWRAIIKAERVESVTDSYYCFRPNPHSATATTNVSVEKSYSKFILFALEIVKIIDEYNPQGAIRDSLVNGVKWGIKCFIDYTKNQNIESRKTIYLIIKSHMKQNGLLKPFCRKGQFLFFAISRLSFIVWNRTINFIK